MSLTEAAPKEMVKDEVIALTLEYQPKFSSTLGSIADLRPDFRGFTTYYGTCMCI